MRVLIAYASKHGATAEIAEHIGQRLAGGGVDSEVRDVATVDDVGGFDAVVLGSGVYAGQWLKAARRFVDDHAAALVEMPVRLFSSGPVGDPLKPDEESAVDVGSILAATNSDEHRLFPGALDKAGLNLAERAIVAAVRAPDGDYRDWEAIDTWTDEIVVGLGDLN